jgi:hypothetical protein
MTVTPVSGEPVDGLQPIEFAKLNFDQPSILASLLQKTVEYFELKLQED